MGFYIAALGTLLVGWTLLSIFVPTASVLNISIFGLITFVVVLIAVRHSYYNRDRKKEIYFALALILIYNLRSFIRTFVIGGYNAVYGLVISQLNNRGVTKINIDQNNWKLDANGQTIFEMIVFFVGAIAAYAYTASMKGNGKGKDTFGTLIGGMAIALFMTYSYILLQPYLGNVYNTNVLEGAKLNLPDVKLPDIVIQRQSNRTPLPGWELWLPLLIVIMIIFYFLFFVKPLTKNRGATAASSSRDSFGIFLVAVILAVALILVILRPTFS